MLGLKWSKYVWKSLWVVGLFILVIFSSQLEQSVKKYVETNFNMSPLFWLYSIVPIVFGVYIALLFVKIRSVKLNPSLIVCVTIPCLFIALYGPIISTIVQNTASTPDSYTVAIPLWMYNTNAIGILSVVAGLTLIVGLFGGKEQSKR